MAIYHRIDSATIPCSFRAEAPAHLEF